MREIQHFKVKILPSKPQPNSIYFVAAEGATAVSTYITDRCGLALPLVDLQGLSSVTGTGVTGTAQNPIVDIATFLSSENGNLITLSTVDGKLYLNSTQDNKVIYFYPTLTELGVLTLEEVTETHIATWIQTQGIIIAEDEIPFFKIELSLTPVYFDPINRPGPSATWPEGQTFNPKTYYITDYVLVPGEGYLANVYEDAAGTIPFVGNGQYRTPSLGGGDNPNLICVYTITSLSKISTQYCRS
jgi:hypothetical protein